MTRCIRGAVVFTSQASNVFFRLARIIYLSFVSCGRRKSAAQPGRRRRAGRCRRCGISCRRHHCHRGNRPCDTADERRRLSESLPIALLRVDELLARVKGEEGGNSYLDSSVGRRSSSPGSSFRGAPPPVVVLRGGSPPLLSAPKDSSLLWTLVVTYQWGEPLRHPPLSNSDHALEKRPTYFAGRHRSLIIE